LFLKNGAVNELFNPFLGAVFLCSILILSYLTRSLKEDSYFIIILTISFISQVSGFYLNGGKVIDYINLLVFYSNLPDLVIFFTLLTYINNKAKSISIIK